MESATDSPAVQQRGVALLADFRELNLHRFRRALGVEDGPRVFAEGWAQRLVGK